MVLKPCELLVSLLDGVSKAAFTAKPIRALLVASPPILGSFEEKAAAAALAALSQSR
jgi:hypothetical protein